MIMNVFCKKPKRNIVTHRNYKHFSNETFMFDVKSSIIQVTCQKNDLEFDRFEAALDEAMQRHARIKNEKINKEITKRSVSIIHF